MQNIRLKIVTAEKDIDNINSEINLALTNESTKEQRKELLYKELEDYNSKNSVVKTQINLLTQFVNDLTEKSKAAQDKIDKINKERSQTDAKTAQLRQAERDKLNERETAGRELSKLEERKINLQNNMTTL